MQYYIISFKLQKLAKQTRNKKLHILSYIYYENDQPIYKNKKN